MTEQEKMIAGLPYDPQDPALVAQRDRARALCQQINTLPAGQPGAIRGLLARLLGADTDAYVTPPFWCDYGTQIRLGRRVYFNFDCVVLDVAPCKSLAPPSSERLRDQVDAFERERIRDALARSAGHQGKAAELLGISRRALIDKLDAYGFERPRKR